MAENNRQDETAPVDADIGEETDIERTAQIINSHEIEALIMSEEPVAKRLEALKGMKTELQARLAKNHGEDLAPLMEQVDSAIDQISSAGGDTGVRSALKTY